MRIRSFGLIAGVALVAAACGSGESIPLAGNDPDTAATTAPATTTGEADSIATGGGDDTSVTTTPADGSAPATTVPTTTTPPLDQFAPCPTDALDEADGPVEVTFWHGMSTTNGEAIDALAAEYNAGQDRVVVNSQFQGGYGETIDKFFQSSESGRPEIVMMPDYAFKRTADSGAVVPIAACIEGAEYDTSSFQPSTLAAYGFAGVQWGMPFNVSNPVLYYNQKIFEDAGLDPNVPPQSLEELRAFSQQIVDSGAAAYGLSLESGSDSGGGWFIEQWFANAGEFYADNDNGRADAATQVLYDNESGVELLTFVQGLIADGLAVYVGDNAGGTDQFLKMADQQEQAAMTIATSAALGTVLDVLAGGLIPDITGDDIGVGPLPGPVEPPSALVGGAALYVTAGKDPEQAAAAWDFIRFMVEAEQQSQWATATGYVPMRIDALDIDPVATVYEDDPRFRVAYDQLIKTVEDPASLGPILGPQIEVREVTANAVAGIFNGDDVATRLSEAAERANALIADYNARNL